MAASGLEICLRRASGGETDDEVELVLASREGWEFGPVLSGMLFLIVGCL